MSSFEKHSNCEERALEALVSGTLHVCGKEVSAEEIRLYLLGEVQLSDEDEAALKACGETEKEPCRPFELRDQTEITESEAFLALHRKRPAGGFSKRTEEEIKRKRDELIEKLRKKRGGS